MAALALARTTLGDALDLVLVCWARRLGLGLGLGLGGRVHPSEGEGW